MLSDPLDADFTKCLGFSKETKIIMRYEKLESTDAIYKLSHNIFTLRE